MAPLDDLFAQHAAASLDKQWALREIIGDGAWPLDIDAGTLSVDGRDVFTVQFLGTVLTGSATWRWAWAERPRVIPAPLLACTRRLRRLGQRRQIHELSAPQSDLGSFDAHRLAMIACGFCDADAYYHGPSAEGTLFVLLRADLLRQRVPSSAARIVQIITYVAAHYPLDHRTALLAYLSYSRCFFYTEGATIAARTAGGEWLHALFDVNDRLIEVAPGHRP